MPNLKISPVAGALGAEISGVDLSQPLSDEVIAEMRASVKLVEAEGVGGEFIHPVVLTHPETGRRAPCVNPAFTTKFEGWSKRGSKPLLDFLFEHCRSQASTGRFRWSPGAIAFWANRSVRHYALNDYPGQRRYMRRVTVNPRPEPATAQDHR